MNTSDWEMFVSVFGCVVIVILSAGNTKSDGSDKSMSEYKPKDVETGEYPDYEKYVDMPSEASAEQTLWQKMLRVS
jgi:hypothetical protein